MSDGYVRIDTKLDESGLRTGLAKLGGIVAAGIGTAVSALAGFGTAIVNLGKEYEAQMSRVQAISGATADELVELDNLAKQLGADTAFSAAEAAEGMENLASAGFSVTEIMGAMPGLLDLAAVSGGDVANASEVAASALRAFGLEATEAGHVADVFAQAAADTNAEVSDMGYAMKYIAPVANAMGISLEETAAAIGILSDAGIKGTQAGTTLRGALTRLTKPTDDMCAVMDDLGLSFYDSEGKMISLADQVAMLQKSFVGLTDEEKQNALTVLYGTSSLSGMLALIDAGPEKLSSLTESFENCDGAAAEMAETMLNNLSGAMENLSGSVETLGLMLYDGIKGPMTEIVNLADGYVSQLQEAFTEGGFDGLLVAVGDVLSQVVSKIAEYAPMAVDAALSLIQSLADGLVSAAPTVASAAVEIGISVISALGSMSATLIELVGELIISLCEAIGANSGQIITAVSDAVLLVVGKLAEYLPLVVTAIVELIPQIVEALTGALPTLLEGLTSLITSIVEALPDLIQVIIEALPDIIQLILDCLVESVPILLEAIVSIITAIVEALPELVVMIIEMLPTIIEMIVASLTELLPQIIGCVVSLVNMLVEQLPTIINTIILALPSIVNGIVAALLDLIPLVVDCGVQLLVSLVQALPDIIYAIVNVLPTIISSIISTLVGLIPLIIECGIELLVSLVSALPEIIIAIVAVLPQIISSIIQALLDSIPLIIQCGIDLLVSLIAALPDIIVALVGAIPTIISSIINALLSNIPLIVQSGIDLLVSLVKALPQIITSLVKAVPQIITALINAFKSGVSKFTTMGKDLLNGLGQGIANAVTGIVDKAIKACKKITDSVKSFFGINSPSKLFEELIGKNLMLGMAVGIDEESSTVEDSLADMADRVAESKFPAPEVDFDYDGVVDNFRAAVGSTRKAISDTLSSSEVSVKSDDSDDVTSAKNNSPEYIENNIYVDGKKTARIITPYVAKELDWEDK